MTAKTVDAALDLEAQLGADRVRAEQERWFRAGLEAALAGIAEHRDGTLSIEEAALLNVLEARIRCLPVPEDV